MEVLLWTGTGHIGTAIVRRIGCGKKIIAGDINPAAAEDAACLLNSAGYDATPAKTDITSRQSIRELIALGERFGEITGLVNSVGVSPSGASIETILSTELYGAAVLLEEAGQAMAFGGAGITVSAGAAYMLPPFDGETEALIGEVPAEELLSLKPFLRENITGRLHAFRLAKYGIIRRMTAQAVKWGERGARLNSISVGLIASPGTDEELKGARGEYYRNMYMKSPVGRLGTADEAANAAELLMTCRGSFISGTDILVDGGALAAYRYGSLKPR